MNRTGWLAVVVGAALLLGLVALGLRRPSSGPALDCAPEHVRFVDGGAGPPLAVCDPGAPVGERPAGAALAAGLKLDLNRASQADLALLPGVGPELAKDLVEARGRVGRFASWDEVDQVSGVGAARLELLQAHTEIVADGPQAP